MKSLIQLTNVEKAKLLHELVPDGIPPLIEYMRQTACLITGEPEKVKENWKDGLFTAEYWISLAQHSKETIGKYQSKLHKSSRLFADQLFDGYNAVFAVHCLTRYIEHNSKDNVEFRQAITLLFT